MRPGGSQLEKGNSPDLERLCILDEVLEGEVLVATCSVFVSTAVAMAVSVSLCVGRGVARVSFRGID
jgi:hypothetical protein